LQPYRAKQTFIQSRELQTISVIKHLKMAGITTLKQHLETLFANKHLKVCIIDKLDHKQGQDLEKRFGIQLGFDQDDEEEDEEGDDDQQRVSDARQLQILRMQDEKTRTNPIYATKNKLELEKQAKTLGAIFLREHIEIDVWYVYFPGKKSTEFMGLVEPHFGAPISAVAAAGIIGNMAKEAHEAPMKEMADKIASFQWARYNTALKTPARGRGAGGQGKVRSGDGAQGQGQGQRRGRGGGLRGRGGYSPRMGRVSA
jgi:hypothetical protein